MSQVSVTELDDTINDAFVANGNEPPNLKLFPLKLNCFQRLCRWSLWNFVWIQSSTLGYNNNLRNFRIRVNPILLFLNALEIATSFLWRKTINKIMYEPILSVRSPSTPMVSIILDPVIVDSFIIITKLPLLIFF